MEKIDLVVPYVDSSDQYWQELFAKYNPIKDKEIEGINARNRFRGQGDFFRLFFRGVATYMPWVNKIHLIVQSESQVPAWINRDTVHIVLHDQFIPQEFLPTFNSTTIEMFLWNIPGLSEKFIYANDDILPTNSILSRDFFESDKVITNVFTVTRLDTIYYNQVDNSYKEIYRHLQSDVVTTGHTMRPYIKSDMIQCFIEHKEDILKSISQFRNSKNFNVYLFSYDLMRKDKLIIKSAITGITSSKIPVLISSISKNPKMNTCIQDMDGEVNIYENQDLIAVCRKRVGRICKYENTSIFWGITKEKLDKIEGILTKIPEKSKESFRIALMKSESL